LIQCSLNSIQLERNFPEPADMRANPAAAFAPGNFSGRIVEVPVGERLAAASVAATFEEFSVHVDNVFCSCLLVQVVHVLSADKQTLLQSLLKSCNGEVGWIRLSCGSNTPTHGVEFPHEPGIAVPSLGRSDFLDSVIPPQTAHATEGWHAAFRAHSRSRENEDTVSA
jgi:hypothetical protein